MTAAAILTVGHSNHPLEHFLGLLARHGVTAVADVRSAPYSRFCPHFNRRALSSALDARGSQYLFLGRELGGRPDDPACYDEEGRVCYDRVCRTERFRDGVRRLLATATTRRIALMCAEKEPLDCHRTLLIARALDRQGVAVAHILAGGGTESHRRTMDRLLAKFDLDPDAELIATREELDGHAVALQTRRVGFSRA